VSIAVAPARVLVHRSPREGAVSPEWVEVTDTRRPGRRVSPSCDIRSRTFSNASQSIRPRARPEVSIDCLGDTVGTARAPGVINSEGSTMLWTLVVILLVLWAIGLVTSTTMGGLLHILLVAAVIVLLVRLIQGRRVA
jgi:uncharacterized protein DUF5670